MLQHPRHFTGAVPFNFDLFGQCIVFANPFENISRNMPQQYRCFIRILIQRFQMRRITRSKVSDFLLH